MGVGVCVVCFVDGVLRLRVFVRRWVVRVFVWAWHPQRYVDKLLGCFHMIYFILTHSSSSLSY